MVLLAALDRRRAIGRKGTMPWHLPDDMKRFKARTWALPVLMGRRTALAIGRALPGRENLVLSHGDAAPFAGQRVVRSLDEAIDLAGGDELIVIGGGEIYALTLPLASCLWLTLIDTVTPDADTFFPEFDPREWRETARAHHPPDAKHALAFDFVDYERVWRNGESPSFPRKLESSVFVKQ
ncbi:MAG: diacylglycerol kinase [Rhodanobacteraceae bacterium]